MSTAYLSQELRGKPIISVTDGNIVAELDDVLIDPDARRVAALVIDQGRLLAGGIKAIRDAEVRIWGRDAVLTNRPDVVVGRDELPGIESWLSVTRQIRGREVIGIDGTRIGILGDVLLDEHGWVLGYDLAQVFVEGLVAYSMQVQAKAARFLSRDALIVDTAQAEEQACLEKDSW